MVRNVARQVNRRRLDVILTLIGVISLIGISLLWINYGGLLLALLLISSSLLLASGITLLCWQVLFEREP